MSLSNFQNHDFMCQYTTIVQSTYIFKPSLIVRNCFQVFTTNSFDKILKRKAEWGQGLIHFAISQCLTSKTTLPWLPSPHCFKCLEEKQFHRVIGPLFPLRCIKARHPNITCITSLNLHSAFYPCRVSRADGVICSRTHSLLVLEWDLHSRY